MCTAWRPTHTLLLAHPRLGDLVDTFFRSRTRDRSFTVVAAMIVDDGIAVVLRVSLQLQRASTPLVELLSDFLKP
jgi:hypothetical protein